MTTSNKSQNSPLQELEEFNAEVNALGARLLKELGPLTESDTLIIKKSLPTLSLEAITLDASQGLKPALEKLHAQVLAHGGLLDAMAKSVQIIMRIEAVARAFSARHTESLKLRPEELDDLARRLLSVWAAGPALELERSTLVSASRKNNILKAAMRHAPAVGNVSPANEEDLVVGTLEVFFAYHWPAVFEAWKLERRPTALAQAPAGMVTGPSAPLSLFGHSGANRQGVALRRGKGGVVERLVVSRGSARLEIQQSLLALTSRVQLGESPTSDEITRGVAQVLGNREMRVFFACFQAAHEDRQAGDTVTEGAFWYWPARFGEMLGLSTAKAARGCDASLEALMSVRVEATIKAKGKPYKLSAQGLVIEGGATIEPMGAAAKEAGKAGRRVRRAMMIPDSILGLLRDGGAWFPLTRDMLAPPPGVDPRVYDDAFRLLMVLSSYARASAAKARRSGLPWCNKVSTVLEASGLMVPSARRHEQIDRLEMLLGVLQKGGHLQYRLEADRLHFDLPLMRPALLQVVEKTKNHRLEGGR